ncbi:MAG TPA: YceI family protein [Polyangia bacterium]
MSIRQAPRVVAAFAVSLVASTSAAVPRDYEVKTPSSRVTVHVYRAGVLSGLGHDHLFSAQRFGGSIRADGSAPEHTRVQLRVAADSLEDGEPGLSASDRAKVNQQTRDQVLEARRYPSIDFVGDHLVLDATGAAAGPGADARVMRGILLGTLTLHGRLKAVRIPFRATVGPDGVVATGEVRLNLRDFGIKAPSAGLGTVKVKDVVVVRFELHAAPGR